MTGQKWKEQKCTAFFNGILQTVTALLELAENSKALLRISWMIYSVNIWSVLCLHVNCNSDSYIHVRLRLARSTEVKVNRGAGPLLRKLHGPAVGKQGRLVGRDA